MSQKKTGGLSYNPLLSRTEPAAATSDREQDMHTRAQVDTSTSERVDKQPQSSRFTFYFTPEQLDRLDRAWERFRREGRRSGQRMSKSLFVRVALDKLLDDFEQNPQEVVELLSRETNR